MSAKWHAPDVSSTPWDELDESSLTPAQRLVMEEHRDAYERLHAPSDRDAAFFNGYVRDACPRCGSRDLVRRGRGRNGLVRWLCNGCLRYFTPVTGTIFEDHKLPVSSWVEFLLELFSYESLEGITRQNRRSPTTVPYWLAKTFAILEGIQDDVVLRGRVQADETYYPIPLAEAEKGKNGLRPGLSRNKICIAVACEEVRGGAGRSIYEVCGRGKPSGKRALDAYGPHIEGGATLVHDKERSHNLVVRERGLLSEAYNSRDLSGLPDKDNPLREVNRLCFLLKVFLERHNGFDRENLPGWLDLFHVIMNPPRDKMEKAAKVLDRAMGNPKTLRYRSYYKQDSR